MNDELESVDVDVDVDVDVGSDAVPTEAPIVAIVGRPNVGKSTLFNRLVGSRQAIVEDRPGVTRDRLYGVADWEGRHFIVVDTGGLDPALETGMPAHIRTQAEVAIEEADLLLFVVDAVEGPTAVDQDIADILRRSSKALLVVANKADSPKRELLAAAAHELGLGETVAVSAQHGLNIGDLCDEILARLPSAPTEAVQTVPPGLRLAFLGRPNAGKSTLVNTLLREPRVIVSDIPGTTRDPIYLPMKWRDQDLVLIDTAGLRRRKQVARAMEKLAAIKSIRTMERTEVVVLVIDAMEGLTDQDQRIARMAYERGKGVIVALHKWDLVRTDGKLAKSRLEDVREGLAFLERPRILKSSVVGAGRDEGKGSGYELSDLLDAAIRTGKALHKRITTSALNEELAAAVAEHAPPLHKGRSVRLYYATQADSKPPLIVISANHGRCLAPAYERYLLRRIRTRWDLRGIPVRLVVRGRGKGGSSPR